MTSNVLVEGGPADGREVPDFGQSLRYPVPLPWNVLSIRDPRPSMEVAEYRRSGNVYRWVGLIDDALAEMIVSAELWRDSPAVRREAQRMLRRRLEHLAPGKEVDRIVWVLGLEPLRSMFHVAAVVGGRRAEHARHIRDRYRAGIFAG